MSKNEFASFVFCSIFCAVLLVGPLSPVAAQGQTYTVLHEFGTGTNDPEAPQGMNAIAQGRDGNLYATATNGGSSNNGAFFYVKPSGTLDLIYSFDFDPGNNPYSGVTLGTDGNYYGTTENNAEGPGTIYKITPAGVATALHTFANTGDGACPWAVPIEATNGLYYGTTTSFCNSDSTIYKITSAGVLTTLYTFTGGNNVTAPLVQGTDGNFYGVTQSGGASNDGVIYKMTPAGVVTILHTFAGSDGAEAYVGLIQATDGNFYGATFSGGTSNAGVAYKITPAGVYTVLHNFNGSTDGSGPASSLVQASNGKLYSVTLTGGSSGDGTIYSLTTTGTFAVLFNFDGANGSSAESPMRQNTNGVLYGETKTGGDLSLCGSGCGVFYSFNVGAPAFAGLVSTAADQGAKVGILGQGFSSSSVVKFDGVQATTIAVTGTTFISATIPAGALTGPVTVKTGTTTLTSDVTFRVLPTFPSFSPTSGPVGQVVTLTGTGLTQTMKVTFNNKSAAFTVVSDTEVTATVPTGATTGKIAITTKGGSVTGATSFTVN